MAFGNQSMDVENLCPMPCSTVNDTTNPRPRLRPHLAGSRYFIEPCAAEWRMATLTGACAPGS